MSVVAFVTRPTDGDTDDRDLVAGVRAGDDRAFEQLFQRYQPRVCAYVRGMVRDHGRAEDITQEIFIAALRRMREETERDINFKPWIFEIAKNRCIDAFRRTRNATEVSLDARGAIGDDEHGRLAAPGATPDSAVEGKLAIDNLCGAFGGLSPVHHNVLVLRELEGLSYREIGERLGMSRPAVESTLFRARRRLSEEYEELVSGRRCLRVRAIVDTSSWPSAGLRDQRRMARHLSHCQPCRRYAARAGVDLGTVRRPAAAAARIAAFLPLPAFLRRRWDGEHAPPLLGHGGSVSQWSANAATVLDPGLVSSWTKAAATVAAVAVASVGAGAAITDRVPPERAAASGAQTRSAGAGMSAPQRAAPRADSARVGQPAAPDAPSTGKRGAATAPAPNASPADEPRAQPKPQPPVGAGPGAPPASGPGGLIGTDRDNAVARPGHTVGSVLDAVGGATGSGADVGDKAGATGGGADPLSDPATVRPLDAATAPLAGAAGAVGQTHATAGHSGRRHRDPATGLVDSVRTTVFETANSTTTADDLGG